MKLIVGLGNPGEKYQGTRHNLGFVVIEELADRIKNQELSWEYKEKLKAEILRLSLIYNSNSLILAKPMTYMNNSGLAVKILMDYYKIPLANLIVIHDELDLPLGKIKIRVGGSAAGHHGVESIIAALGEDKFLRMRLGIGPVSGTGLAVLAEHKKSSFNVDHFVLEPFVTGEKAKVKQLIKRATEALETLLQEGIEVAQREYH